MLRIRLRKPGKPIKGRCHWKVVVTEGSFARESKFVEQLGYYNPANELLKIDTDQFDAWVAKGAQPTQTVSSLVKRIKKGQSLAKKKKVVKKKSKKAKKSE
jgi:small subunit ribosomal protein S16